MFVQFQSPLALAARILIALLFLPAGLNKLVGFSGTVGYIASTGLPLPELGAVIAIVVEVGGALALLVGYQARWAALTLAVFTLAASVIFHNFWALAPAQAMVQQLLFFKNVAVVGGLILLMAFGPGALSLDDRRKA